jgi:hypothetical protein
MVLQNEAALALGALFLSFVALAGWRLRAGYRPPLRPIAGYELLASSPSESAESGRPVCVSIGAGTLGSEETLLTLAGLDIVDGLAQPSATVAGRLVVTTASPVALPMAQAMLRRSYEAAGVPEEYEPTQARFVTDQRQAYALAVADGARQERPVVSAVSGDWGDEYLLAGEPHRLAGVPLVAGAANEAAIPFVWATADHPLIGEEIFAAGAYLGRGKAALASVMAQDQMRLLLVLVILAGVAVESLAPR